MLERFSDQIEKLTPGQKWRLKCYLYRLEERELDDDEIETEILEYCVDCLGFSLDN